jgi:ABC-2 type transport system ATP-binding protein
MIQVKNLVKRFGEFTAVDNVSFDVPAGEIFAFLGPTARAKPPQSRC